MSHLAQREAPWSGQTGWHVADWGPLGWAETAVKSAALTLAVVAAAGRLVDSGTDSGWTVPDGHQVPFWLIVAVAVGYLVTFLDRLADREIIAVVFVIATVVGYWSLVWVVGLDAWPGALVRAFAALMLAGEMTKVAYFVTTGARVRNLPRSLPLVMTGALAFVHLLVAVTA